MFYDVASSIEHAAKIGSMVLNKKPPEILKRRKVNMIVNSCSGNCRNPY